MQLRWIEGPEAKPGEVVEVEDSVGRAYVAAGKAEPVETAEIADVAETPERPKNRARRTAPKAEPETR